MDDYEEKFYLGDKVRDLVTGFEGIAISKVVYLNGCIQYCVKPPVDENGKMIEGEYIDIEQLELVESGVINTDYVYSGGYKSDTPPTAYR